MFGTNSTHNPKCILVTGSEGNIGSFIIDAIHRDHPAATVIRVAHSHFLNKQGDQERRYQGDLADPAFLKKIFSENPVDYVIHAAAMAYTLEGFTKNPYELIRNDIQCLLTTLNESKSCRKFIYLSSSTVYESSSKFPFEEADSATTPLPRSPYGIAKYFGEQAVTLFNKQYSVPFTIWRMFNVVSPLESHEKPGGHVFVDFYRSLIEKQEPILSIYGNGYQIRCFTWVEDIASIVSKQLTNPSTDNEIFNAGSNHETTLIELKDLMLSIARNKKIIPKTYQPEIKTGTSFYGVDSAKRIPSLKKIESILNIRSWTNPTNCFTKFIELKIHK